MQIQWYPGHMTKAKRMLEETIPQIDVVLEVRDARIPLSSFNPDIEPIVSRRARIVLLNKADLGDPKANKQWVAYFARQGIPAIEYVATRRGSAKMVLDRIQQAAKARVDKLRERGVSKTIRVMVVGIPNVGKSTLINNLSGGGKAKTANRPGVTRGKQWIRVTPYLELLDTPGLLWPKFEDPLAGRNLAFIGSIRDEITDVYALCLELLGFLKEAAPALLAARYKLNEDDLTLENDALLERICQKRGFILSGGRLDIDRGVAMVMDEFRDGKIGRITIERPQKDGDTEAQI